MTDYSHPDHGEMERRTVTTPGRGEHDVYRCERCHVMTPVDDTETFDTHDCDHYKKIQENISGNL